MAVSAVKTAKRIIKRAKESKIDVYLAIFDHGNTPKKSTRNSQAQSRMNRRTKTVLPTTASMLVPKLTYGQHSSLQDSKQRQACYCDRHARELQLCEKEMWCGSTEQPQAGTEREAPADDQTYSTNRSMTVVTPPEAVILREQTATLPTTALTIPQRATTVDRVVTRSGRAVNPPALYRE